MRPRQTLPDPRRAAVGRASAVASALALALFLAACGGGGDPATPDARSAPAEPPSSITTGTASPDVRAAAAELVVDPLGEPSLAALGRVGDTGDLRYSWLLVDLLRFQAPGPGHDALVAELRELTGQTVADGATPWVHYSHLLSAWEVPAPPEYAEAKKQVLTTYEPAWEPVFAASTSLDWRLVTAEGSRADQIVPLDGPAVIAAGDADWLPEDEVVVGVVVEGTARAYPRRMLEAHQVVNDSLDGRRVAVTHSSPCEAAVAYLVDEVPDTVAPMSLRPSGLVDRSNALLVDTESGSLVGQLRGEALSGPLADAGVTLRSVDVDVTTWGEWRKARPDTTVLAEDGGIGRVYVERPLGGETTGGDALPRGVSDPRFPDDEMVLGVLGADGSDVAFAVDALRTVLTSDDAVEEAGVVVRLDGDGFEVVDAATGESRSTRQARWFAWSQFWPDTAVWTP